MGQFNQPDSNYVLLLLFLCVCLSTLYLIHSRLVHYVLGSASVAQSTESLPITGISWRDGWTHQKSETKNMLMKTLY